MKNVVINVLLAPYRLDYFNYMSENLNCDIYFEQKGFEGQLFSTEELEKKCTFQPLLLNTKKKFNRNWVTNIGRILKKNNPNFVIVPEFSITTFKVILYKLFHRGRFKIVSMCDDSYDILKGNGFSKMHHFARKIALPFIDEIILVDNKSAQWYKEHYNKGFWLPIIRNEKQFIPYISSLEDQALNIRQQYAGKKLIVFVGRMIKEKNIVLLIHAYQSLQDDYELFLIGDGELREELEKLCKTLDVHVHFIGQQEGDKLHVWYKVADVFVLPSYREPFGAVVNEALLAGCTCVLSENVGASCLIKPGENGYLFNPTSVEELIRSIQKACMSSSSNCKESKMHVSFVDCMNKLKQCLDA